jgi:hypothetical protein
VHAHISDRRPWRQLQQFSDRDNKDIDRSLVDDIIVIDDCSTDGTVSGSQWLHTRRGPQRAPADRR